MSEISLVHFPDELLYYISDIGQLTMRDLVALHCTSKRFDSIKTHQPIMIYKRPIDVESTHTIPPAWLQQMTVIVDIHTIDTISETIRHIYISNDSSPSIPHWIKSIQGFANNRITLSESNNIEEISADIVKAYNVPTLRNVYCGSGYIIGCNIHTLSMYEDEPNQVELVAYDPAGSQTIGEIMTGDDRTDEIIFGGSAEGIKNLFCNRDAYNVLSSMGLRADLDYLYITWGGLPNKLGNIHTFEYNLYDGSVDMVYNIDVQHIETLKVNVISYMLETGLYNPIIYANISRLEIDFPEDTFSIIVIPKLPNLKSMSIVGGSIRIGEQPSLHMLELNAVSFNIQFDEGPIFDNLNEMTVKNTSVCSIRCVVAPKLRILNIELRCGSHRDSLQRVKDAFPSLVYINKTERHYPINRIDQ